MSKQSGAHRSSLYNLLKRPIVTEKSTTLSAYNQYVFEVDKQANKIELAKALELAYPGRKVSAVRLITIPARTRRVGKRTAVIPERRKAVFTIVGEPLELLNH